MNANRANGASIPTWRLWIGICTVPGAWILQVCIAEALVSQNCFAHDAPLHAPLAHGARWAVVIVSVLALLAGIVGAWFTWRNFRCIEKHSGQALPGETRNPGRAEAFITRVGVMVSVLFLFALVATDVAAGLISACAW